MASFLRFFFQIHNFVIQIDSFKLLRIQLLILGSYTHTFEKEISEGHGGRALVARDSLFKAENAYFNNENLLRISMQGTIKVKAQPLNSSKLLLSNRLRDDENHDFVIVVGENEIPVTIVSD